MTRIGQQLLDVLFPEMLKSMGLAVAEAQYELDLVGMRLAQMMTGEYDAEDPENPGEFKRQTALVKFGGEELSLLELGFTPTFYQFVDSVIEVKVSISISFEREQSVDTSTTIRSGMFGVLGFAGGYRAKTSTVSAAYAAKYQYSAEGSSLLRTKLVPVPPPAVLEERIRQELERRTDTTS